MLREKTKDEVEKEEEEYKEFLEREVGHDLHELITVAGDEDVGVSEVKEEEEEEGATKEERKKARKDKKRKAKDIKRKEDQDQQFLFECVLTLLYSYIRPPNPFLQLHTQPWLDRQGGSTYPDIP